MCTAFHQIRYDQLCQTKNLIERLPWNPISKVGGKSLEESMSGRRVVLSALASNIAHAENEGENDKSAFSPSEGISRYIKNVWR